MKNLGLSATLCPRPAKTGENYTGQPRRIEPQGSFSLRAAVRCLLYTRSCGTPFFVVSINRGRAALISFILCPYGPTALISELHLGREDILFRDFDSLQNLFWMRPSRGPYNGQMNREHGRRCPAGKPGAEASPARDLRKQMP